jgi:hypothetical protein
MTGSRGLHIYCELPAGLVGQLLMLARFYKRVH